MLRDLAYAVRTLRRTPGFTTVAVVSLALGIGANSAIFTLADGIILRPMAVPHPSKVIAVQSQLRGESVGGVFQYSEVSYPDFLDLRARNTSFAGMAASQFSPFGFTLDTKSLPRMKFGMLVSGDFFRVLGVEPILGRSFRPAEDQAPGDAVAVLSYELWKNEFAGSPDAIGRTVFLNGVAFTVIGVAPRSFIGPHPLVQSALYVPMAMCLRLQGGRLPNPLDQRGQRGAFVHGRLKPGITVAQASAEALVIGRQLADAYPETNRTCSFVVETELQSRLNRSPLDVTLLLFLLALAGVVLLIACANVMNLMLSRGRARAREIAIRLAIGAGRRRLIRQLLAESLVIALLGGGLGLLVAEAGTELFAQMRIPTDIPILLDFRLDPRALLFTLAACVASLVLFGLAPAFQTTRPELASTLKAGGAVSSGRRRLFGRNALVVVQVAGSLLLLVVASQAYRGAAMLLSSPAGFRTDHLLAASFDPSLARYTDEQTQKFYRRLVDQSRTLPGVRGAALAEAVPMIPGATQTRIIPEGVQLSPGTEAVEILSNRVTEDYFTVLDIPIVEGRPFAVTDRADSPPVAIVNQFFARKYYPGQSAVGKRFRLETAGGPLVEIVGVARQSKYFFLVEPAVDYLYLPFAQPPAKGQQPTTGLNLLLYTAGPPGELAAPLRSLVGSIDSGQPVIGLRTMEDIFDQRARKTFAIMIQTVAGLGLLGLALALVGLYGLMTYSVGLRQREIGIRMAVGADRVDVVRMVLRQGLALAGAGVAIGVVLWLLASRPLLRFLEASSFSWSLLALVAAGLLAAAALGAYLPARRASLVDPNLTLRQD